MVALTNLNLPPEAWNARLLRAVPNCSLVLMLSYHMLSPALSVEETGLMTYLQAPPDAGPSVVQVTTGLQYWKQEGDWLRLVEGCPPQRSFTSPSSRFLQAFGSEQESELARGFHLDSERLARCPYRKVTDYKPHFVIRSCILCCVSLRKSKKIFTVGVASLRALTWKDSSMVLGSQWATRSSPTNMRCLP